MIRPILAVLVSLSLLAPAVAQAPAAGGAKAVSRLGRAPVSGDLLRVRLPRPTRQTLPNGLTVLVVPQRKVPTVAVTLWVRGGALSDPEDMPGLAKFAAEMLREGTAARSSAQLSAEIDELGASLDAGAEFGSDVSQVVATGMSEDLERLLELMSDAVIRPAFPESELEKYKKRELAGLEELHANPEFLAKKRFHAALYGAFPASRVAPTRESIAAATSERLRRFHAERYRPGGSILAVGGDVEPERVLALVRKAFGGWKGSPAAAPELPPVPAAPARTFHVVDRPDSVQTEIVAGGLSLRRADPDYIALTVANRILGGGASGRLFMNLREEKGYTYGAYSGFAADVYPGPFSARTAVRNQVTEGALTEILGELKRLREEPVPAAELDEARRALVARFALSLESTSTLLNAWLTTQYFGLPDDYWDRYTELLSQTGPDGVQAIARKVMDSDRLQFVFVGDAKTVLPVLSKFGPVRVYDVEGKERTAP